MNITALHALIQRAHQHEASTGHLSKQMQAHAGQLHPSIRLPSENTSGVLQQFVSAYIEQVPELLLAAQQVAQEAGIEAHIKPVLKIAEQFFLQPPALMAGHEGLEGLLDEAYLAHRLVEEVNDRYITHLGAPLIPLDTTVANLIAHQLIGEPFANQLDEAVHHAVEGMLDDASFAQGSVQAYRERLHSPQTEAAWLRWPCLSRRLGVELQLDETRAAG
ncbi:hypothetical protein [Pseudomonas sp. GWSMS-1]|uniref:hypothetical protein n=1 Tax=Pseudomonas sp. GWSMS-1 TaxID=3308997 RepID=UPI003CEF4272